MRAVQLEPEPGFFNRRAEDAREVCCRHGQVRLFITGFSASSLDSCEIKERVYKLQQPKRVAVCGLKPLQTGRRKSVCGLCKLILQRPQHECERGTQLVAHV